MAPPLQTVEESYNLQGHMAAQYKNDGQPPRGIPLMMPSTESAVPYTNLLPQVIILNYCNDMYIFCNSNHIINIPPFTPYSDLDRYTLSDIPMA